MEEQIYRCTDSSELQLFSPEDSAFLIDNYNDTVPSGYGLYIRTENIKDCIFYDKNIVVSTEKLVPGNFIRVRFNNGKRTIDKLFTGDIPDRTLFITGQCNSNCIMCPYSTVYRDQSSPEPVDRQLKYISLMNPNADYLCITGGEPTIIGEGFLSIMQATKIHFNSTLIHILTNGRTFSYRDFADEFRKVRPYRTILGIPLHASNAELHDKITRSRDSFYQTTYALDYLHAIGEHLEIRIVVTKLNYQNLPELADMIAQRYPNVRHVCIMGMEMLGNARINLDEVWIPFNDVIPYVEKATDILINHGIQVQHYNFPLCLLHKKYRQLYRKSITPSKVTFLPKCERCKEKEDCGGFFFSTASMKNINILPIED